MSSSKESFDKFIQSLHDLKKEQVIRTKLSDNYDYIKNASLYQLNENEKVVMKVLWSTGYYIFSEQEISNMLKQNDIKDNEILKSLCEKSYLIKSVTFDKERSFLRKFHPRYMYSIGVPETLYCEKLEDLINMVSNNTNFLHIGLNKSMINEEQLKEIRRICKNNGVD